MRLIVAAIAAVGLIALACTDDDGVGNTLKTVEDRDELKCGVKTTQPGFGFVNPSGTNEGNDVEFCKAVAAAVLGNANAVEYVPATAGDRFELLAAGEIDVLIRTTTWTTSRDADLKGSFAATTFYDGQGMMVSSDSRFETLADLSNATICVTSGTTTESNLDDVFQEEGVPYTPLAFGGESADEQIQAAFIEGRCDAWTADLSNLAGQRANFPAAEGGPDALRILPITISKEPLGPVTRDNDSEWFDVVNWVVFGMIAAEEFGVNSQNVDQMIANPPTNNIARLLGVGFQGGEPTELGLAIDNTFMQNVLKQVGNFGEVYDRTIAPIGIPREGSVNDLWTRGGLMYAPPIR
jgi:general L-amino acid transport system substrate-binding protein